MGTELRKTWVLGGTGYIGTALVNHLSKDPNNLLHLLVHKRGDRRYLESFNTFSGGLADMDYSWLLRYPPDIVFHLARPAGSNFLTRRIRALMGARANNRLIRMLASLEKPPVVVYVSGSLMYGEMRGGETALENTPLNPEAYARYYIRNEQPWLDARHNLLPDIRFARPGWIAGPDSWFREFFWKPYLETGKVPCYGNCRMSLIHLDDCAAMIDTLGSCGQKGQNLNIFSCTIAQDEFCEILARKLNAGVLHMKFSDTQSKYGRVTAKALTSSIPMDTLYPEIHQKTAISCRTADEIIEDVVNKLRR
jgi:nucleoside-diphosphate-sugar epimerase